MSDTIKFSQNRNFLPWLYQMLMEWRYEVAFSALITAIVNHILLTGNKDLWMLLPVALGSAGVQDAFKHNRARRNVIVAGGLILVCITLLSCVSSFMIYREGFADMPWFVQQGLSLFAVIVVEGCFVWLVYGFTRAFSSFAERLISLAGLGFLVLVMLTNIITHFMMVKHITLAPFQESWLAWGAVSVFIVVLVFVLLITLADPVGRLVRQELRVQGKQQEVILQAKGESVESEQIQLAMIERAEIEAMELAERIINQPQRVSRGTAQRLSMAGQEANFDRGRRSKK